MAGAFTKALVWYHLASLIDRLIDQHESYHTECKNTGTQHFPGHSINFDVAMK